MSDSSKPLDVTVDEMGSRPPEAMPPANGHGLAPSTAPGGMPFANMNDGVQGQPQGLAGAMPRGDFGNAGNAHAAQSRTVGAMPPGPLSRPHMPSGVMQGGVMPGGTMRGSEMGGGAMPAGSMPGGKPAASAGPGDAHVMPAGAAAGNLQPSDGGGQLGNMPTGAMTTQPPGHTGAKAPSHAGAQPATGLQQGITLGGTWRITLNLQTGASTG